MLLELVRPSRQAWLTGFERGETTLDELTTRLDRSVRHGVGSDREILELGRSDLVELRGASLESGEPPVEQDKRLIAYTRAELARGNRVAIVAGYAHALATGEERKGVIPSLRRIDQDCLCLLTALPEVELLLRSHGLPANTTYAIFPWLVYRSPALSRWANRPAPDELHETALNELWKSTPTQLLVVLREFADRPGEYTDEQCRLIMDRFESRPPCAYVWLADALLAMWSRSHLRTDIASILGRTRVYRSTQLALVWRECQKADASVSAHLALCLILNGATTPELVGSLGAMGRGTATERRILYALGNLAPDAPFVRQFLREVALTSGRNADVAREALRQIDARP